MSRHAIPLDVRFHTVPKRRRIGGCLIWMGGTRSGYGMIGSGGTNSKPLYAHRVAYELAYGPIPDGMYVCHHCDNPPCVEPTHLFLGTQQDNEDDCVSKRRHMHGATHYNAKMTTPQVIEARLLYATGEFGYYRLGIRFNVNPTTIRNIIKGYTRQLE